MKGTDLQDESGQATAEYALVLIAAAVIALALIVWAANSEVLPEFFRSVIRRIRGVVSGAPIG